MRVINNTLEQPNNLLNTGPLSEQWDSRFRQHLSLLLAWLPLQIPKVSEDIQHRVSMLQMLNLIPQIAWQSQCVIYRLSISPSLNNTISSNTQQLHWLSLGLMQFPHGWHCKWTHNHQIPYHLHLVEGPQKQLPREGIIGHITATRSVLHFKV